MKLGELIGRVLIESAFWVAVIVLAALALLWR